MAFRHGVYTSELPTSILPARSVDSNVVFAVGTAAVDRLEAGKPRYVNRLRMYYSYDEFVSEMGWDEENFNKYSLQELAYSHFALYRGAPLVVCNVFDPAVHKTSVSSEAVSFDAKGAASLKHGSVSRLVLKNAESSTTYVEGTDYTKAADSETIETQYEPNIPPTTGRVLYINKRIENQAQAERMAKAELRDKNRKEQTASLSGMGDTRFRAGTVLDIQGWGRFDSKYVIAQATHTFSADGGYTTSLELEKALDY